ncbi:RNA polymerase sigma factor SigC [Limnoraphis robusta Tam1]|uniref:RNA polymerase sigma factor n=2 Tax=Limnoraphis TaxID=1332112 RepID=A0ABU5U340_9CYAN|nr:RNA polymerase sigma factor SigC [Limnoraphis robusta]MEA5521596.1 RNA polymerase sigma factor SigC [Limnoraphis robusta CCNP1315]MEA5540395.1 RNA polymerase sigma factor SigC [Limnoraphis robusta Tam1]MEA5545220.1 RNA polymerase sigma factor SigC [Limnoraphis robusta CCNP1324]
MPEPSDLDLSMEDTDTPQQVKNINRRITDLVRVYLQEIGRVRLLGRDEEVAEAQKVQRYQRLIQLRDKAASQEKGILETFTRLIQTRDRLTAQLGHLPSLERWANVSGVELSDLKPIIAKGKQRWAELAKLTVGELDQFLAEGIQAKDHMIKANLRLVVSVAKKYQNRGLELLDLIQEGTLGLERAVEKFDPTSGYRFSTYSYWWIRQSITRAIATLSRTICLPVHITETLNKIKKAQCKIYQEKSRIATIDEIAAELEMTPVQVGEVLLNIPHVVSLEALIESDEYEKLIEFFEAKEPLPEDQLMQESLRRDLQQLLAELSDREREVIEMRYGLGNGHTYSLAEIGRELELSHERVRQIEAKALQKLRQPKLRNRVRDYLESLT